MTITVTGAVNHPPVGESRQLRGRQQRGVERERGRRGAGQRHGCRRRYAERRSAERHRWHVPFTGTSAKGAAVTVNADGSFSYDPTGSAPCRPFRVGRAPRTRSPTEPTMATAGRATATVTITVTGAVNHPPVAVADTASTNNAASFMLNTSVCWPTTPIPTAIRCRSISSTGRVDRRRSTGTSALGRGGHAGRRGSVHL